MKAIIVAAGKGSRLKDYTRKLPKCMLKFGNKTLLQRQFEALRANDINDITVIKGYMKEKIKYGSVKYYNNNNYENNNILNSLFCAESELNDDVIISYSDILYSKEVVKRLLTSIKDISIVVDIEWMEYYKGRKMHSLDEAEKVVLDADNKVVEIGKIISKKYDVYGEFIGMMKLSKRGTDILKHNFHRAKNLFWGKPFHGARIFEKAYLTDMIQDLVSVGIDVHCVIIRRGWKEIDTVEDYKKALKDFSA